MAERAAVLAQSTLQQEWLWKALERGKNWNHLLYAYALRVSGEFDGNLFGRCLTELTRRHSVLRSELVMQEQELHQRVSPSGRSWLVEDVPSADARCVVEAFFNSMTGPKAAGLFEAKILRLSHRVHVIAIAIHHIITDAYSISLMFRELWSSYAGCAAQRLPAMEYTDYARWQRRVWRDGGDCLHRAPRLRLAGDVTADSEPKEFAVVIEEPLAASVRKFARESRTLVAIVMFAAYAAVVARWCGVRDLLIPFATSGRHLPEHEEMIGFFSYYLYVRLGVGVSDSFSTLLDTATRRCYDALGHQDFARGLEREPELMSNPSFNWVSVSEEQTSGLPSPDAHFDFTVEPFAFQRTLQKAVDQFQSYAGVILWDTGKAFRGKFYLCPAGAGTADKFLQAYRNSILQLIHEPDSLLFVA